MTESSSRGIELAVASANDSASPNRVTKAAPSPNAGITSAEPCPYITAYPYLAHGRLAGNHSCYQQLWLDNLNEKYMGVAKVLHTPSCYDENGASHGTSVDVLYDALEKRCEAIPPQMRESFRYLIEVGTAGDHEKVPSVYKAVFATTVTNNYLEPNEWFGSAIGLMFQVKEAAKERTRGAVSKDCDAAEKVHHAAEMARQVAQRDCEDAIAKANLAEQARDAKSVKACGTSSKACDAAEKDRHAAAEALRLAEKDYEAAEKSHQAAEMDHNCSSAEEDSDHLQNIASHIKAPLKIIDIDQLSQCSTFIPSLPQDRPEYCLVRKGETYWGTLKGCRCKHDVLEPKKKPRKKTATKTYINRGIDAKSNPLWLQSHYGVRQVSLGDEKKREIC